MKKKIIIVLAVLIGIYSLFVATDCIRLKYAESVTKPFVTVGFEETENRDTYTGLGYSVTYYVDRYTDENGVAVESNYGAEFRLFDKMLIWGWVE